jgi:hypothetical protein
MNEEAEQGWNVPAILVMKHRYSVVQKKSPINFLINENTARDLPRFAYRLVGPDLQPVATEEELNHFIRSPMTDQVSFVVWSKRWMQNEAMMRIVSIERWHSLYLVFSPDPDGSPVDVEKAFKKFNPEGASFTAHAVDTAGNLTHRALDPSIKPASEWDLTWTAIQSLVDEAKTRRPGHAHDDVQSLQINELFQPPDDAQRRTHDGDIINVNIIGRNLNSGSQFLKLDLDVVKIGAAGKQRHPDLPALLVERGLSGMAPLQKREVIIPPRQGYSEEECPPEVSVNDRLQFVVEFIGFADEGPNHQGQTFDDTPPVRGPGFGSVDSNDEV